MPNRIRLALLVLGLAAVVYGTALYTGGWLGVPPHFAIVTTPDGKEVYPKRGLTTEVEEALNGMVLALVGLVVVAIGAWPRRRRVPA